MMKIIRCCSIHFNSFQNKKNTRASNAKLFNGSLLLLRSLMPDIGNTNWTKWLRTITKKSNKLSLQIPMSVFNFLPRSTDDNTASFREYLTYGSIHRFNVIFIPAWNSTLKLNATLIIIWMIDMRLYTFKTKMGRISLEFIIYFTRSLSLTNIRIEF